MMLRSLVQQTARLSLLANPAVTNACQVQCRGTCIFRRMYAPIPGKNGRRRGFRKRHYVYILEENTTNKPAGDMEVLLLEHVEGVGLKGDVVKVAKKVARHQLLPANVATYPTEENLSKIKHELQSEGERPRQSIWAQKTIQQLHNAQLYIPMNAKYDWTLDKTHVRIAFRKKGIELTEDCLDLPKEPISGPGDLTVNVTVNGMEVVPVNAKIFYYTKELAKSLPGRKIL